MTQSASLYDAAYAEGYNAALREIKASGRAVSHIREYKPLADKRTKAVKAPYLIQQKIAGAALMAASVIGLVANKGDFAVALFTIPIGILIFVTNRRLFK